MSTSHTSLEALQDCYGMLHAALDNIQPGDRITVTRTDAEGLNSIVESAKEGSPAKAHATLTQTSFITGPAVILPREERTNFEVSIDLLNSPTPANPQDPLSSPHPLRDASGDLVGHIIHLDVIRDRVMISTWRLLDGLL